MIKQNKKVHLILLFISIVLFSDLVFTVQAQTDESLVYQNESNIVVENITLIGDGTGIGLTLVNCSRVSLYNVHIENFAIGIKIEGGLANNIYNPQLLYNTEIGLLLTGEYGITRVFGGSITANGVGIEIDAFSMMNQFYGVEIEVNIQNEVTLGDGTYGNLFEGSYFERIDSTSPDFFDMTKAIGINTFYANKFASQGASSLEVFGDSNVFADNIFDSGTVILTIHGNKNIFRDNRQGPTYAEIILTDAGTETQYRNNFFVADNLPQLPSESNLPSDLPHVSSKDPAIPKYSFPIILLLFIAVTITSIATLLLIKNILTRKTNLQKSRYFR
jgi:hypothetical protein